MANDKYAGLKNILVGKVITLANNPFGAKIKDVVDVIPEDRSVGIMIDCIVVATTKGQMNFSSYAPPVYECDEPQNEVGELPSTVFNALQEFIHGPRDLDCVPPGDVDHDDEDQQALQR